jgi:uncharacterized OB-fold protein
VECHGNRVTLQYCKRCGRTYYPPKARCYCGSTEFGEKTLDSTGTIVTYTVIHVPPAGFTPPLRVAIAEFNGFKLLGRLWEGFEPRVGEPVEAVERDGVVFFRKPGDC